MLPHLLVASKNGIQEISEITKALNSNGTTTLPLTHTQGYTSFYGFIAGYRIKAFCETAQKEDISNVNEAFFNTGLCSRTTAYEQFKKHKGTTPSEYIKKIRKEKHI